MVRGAQVDPFSVGDIAGRVVEGHGSIAAGLVMDVGVLGVVEKGVGHSTAEVDAGAVGGIDTGQEEEER